MRRCMPAMPWRNMGKKTQFIRIIVGQKWTLFQNSLIIRPVALGYQ